MKERIKVKILRLDSCGGCMQRFFTNPSLIQISESFEFIEHHNEEKTEFLFIEGFATNKEQEKLLKNAILNSKQTVVFGSCAVQPEIIISSPDIKKSSDYAKVRTELVGCPPSNEEINELISNILLDKKFKTINTPVCDDCAKNEIICLLLKGISCDGDKTKGECKVLCMKIGKECASCRTSLGEQK